jgi:L-histidine N-alpha-methyltransferase
LRTEAEFRAGLARDVRAGLGASPKELPPKYFYDARGSELFEEITRLPEYYLTRAETAILERHADEIVERAGADRMLEIGGGFSHKTELLLRPFERDGGRAYASLDVSQEALESAAQRLGRTFPGIAFSGIVGDFELDLVRLPVRDRTLYVFLGSTIGNLEGEGRASFLENVRSRLGEGGSFLVGFDLVKPKDRLDAAYDDSRGVTAEFNRNVLRVLNRELDGDLPVEEFLHRAAYDARRARIEMWLVAPRPVRARLAALELDVAFDVGEAVRTEISCKFERGEVERELSEAGMRLELWITDPSGDFALALARPEGPRAGGPVERRGPGA